MLDNESCTKLLLACGRKWAVPRRPLLELDVILELHDGIRS